MATRATPTKLAGDGEVVAFFDDSTNTIQYVVGDTKAKRCAIIDAVLVYDPVTGRTSTRAIEDMIALIYERGFKVDFVMETHAHADHLSAAPLLGRMFGAPVCIGEHIGDVQKVFKDVFNIKIETDGSDFGRLFKNGEEFHVGGMKFQVMHTPGHTPACVSYYLPEEKAVFTGDTIFMPDQGSARCDFPGGSSSQLWDSIQKILSLPEDTKLFTCHDYMPGGRPLAWETTVGEEKVGNIHVKVGTVMDDFIKWRSERDASLKLPRLLYPAIQCNIRAGNMPPLEGNGQSYIKIPVDFNFDEQKFDDFDEQK